ncbi:MAG: nuclear transport factor 2 family protein [Pseudomonadota bacterium]
MHSRLDEAAPNDARAALGAFVSEDWHWRGMHPFHELRGSEAVARQIWTPLKNAIKPMQRRPDIFIANLNALDDDEDAVWVVEMGHLMGLFDRPWLGIRHTLRIVMLRYCEFNKVVDGKVVETAMFFDIPHLMMQAGQNPFPPQTGTMLIQPGPRTHDGLCYDPQDAALSEATHDAIESMIFNPGPKAFNRDEADNMAEVWHEDMIWWGPAGIGAAYTIERYIRQHSMPFDRALSAGYRFNGHICRLAEGSYGGFFGWPNLTVQNSGSYLGMTAGSGPADMRVVDMYRVQDGKIAENWVFIDILHFLNMQGLDVLDRMERIQSGGG